MSVRDAIEEKLKRSLAPQHLEITDESASHAGHAGAPPGGESHFRIEVVSGVFSGLSRLERQRMVHDLLAEELAGPVHALVLKIRAPEES